MKREWKTSELEKMIEEATVDCYNEVEEFSGMLCTLQDRLSFPFEAVVLGETAKVIGIDESRSSINGGILVKVVKKGKPYPAALSTIELADRTSPNAKWIEAFRYWAGL